MDFSIVGRGFGETERIVAHEVPDVPLVSAPSLDIETRILGLVARHFTGGAIGACDRAGEACFCEYGNWLATLSEDNQDAALEGELAHPNGLARAPAVQIHDGRYVCMMPFPGNDAIARTTFEQAERRLFFHWTRTPQGLAALMGYERYRNQHLSTQERRILENLESGFIALARMSPEDATDEARRAWEETVLRAAVAATEDFANGFSGMGAEAARAATTMLEEELVVQAELFGHGEALAQWFSQGCRQRGSCLEGAAAPHVAALTEHMVGYPAAVELLRDNQRAIAGAFGVLSGYGLLPSEVNGASIAEHLSGTEVESLSSDLAGIAAHVDASVLGALLRADQTNTAAQLPQSQPDLLSVAELERRGLLRPPEAAALREGAQVLAQTIQAEIDAGKRDLTAWRPADYPSKGSMAQHVASSAQQLAEHKVVIAHLQALLRAARRGAGNPRVAETQLVLMAYPELGHKLEVDDGNQFLFQQLDTNGTPEARVRNLRLAALGLVQWRDSLQAEQKLHEARLASGDLGFEEFGYGEEPEGALALAPVLVNMLGASQDNPEALLRQLVVSNALMTESEVAERRRRQAGVVKSVGAVGAVLACNIWAPECSLPALAFLTGRSAVKTADAYSSWQDAQRQHVAGVRDPRSLEKAEKHLNIQTLALALNAGLLGVGGASQWARALATESEATAASANALAAAPRLSPQIPLHRLRPGAAPKVRQARLPVSGRPVAPTRPAFGSPGQLGSHPGGIGSVEPVRGIVTKFAPRQPSGAATAQLAEQPKNAPQVQAATQVVRAPVRPEPAASPLLRADRLSKPNTAKARPDAGGAEAGTLLDDPWLIGASTEGAAGAAALTNFDWVWDAANITPPALVRQHCDEAGCATFRWDEATQSWLFVGGIVSSSMGTQAPAHWGAPAGGQAIPAGAMTMSAGGGPSAGGSAASTTATEDERFFFRQVSQLLARREIGITEQFEARLGQRIQLFRDAGVAPSSFDRLPPHLAKALEDTQRELLGLLAQRGIGAEASTLGGRPVVRLTDVPAMFGEQFSPFSALYVDPLLASDGGARFYHGPQSVAIGIGELASALSAGYAPGTDHELGHFENLLDAESPYRGFFDLRGGFRDGVLYGKEGQEFGADEARQQLRTARYAFDELSSVLAMAPEEIVDSIPAMVRLFDSVRGTPFAHAGISILEKQIQALEQLETALRSNSPELRVGAEGTARDIRGQSEHRLNTREDFFLELGDANNGVRLRLPWSIGPSPRNMDKPVTWLADFLAQQRQELEADLDGAQSEIARMEATEEVRTALARRVLELLGERGVISMTSATPPTAVPSGDGGASFGVAKDPDGNTRAIWLLGRDGRRVRPVFATREDGPALEATKARDFANPRIEPGEGGLVVTTGSLTFWFPADTDRAQVLAILKKARKAKSQAAAALTRELTALLERQAEGQGAAGASPKDVPLPEFGNFQELDRWLRRQMSALPRDVSNEPKGTLTASVIIGFPDGHRFGMKHEAVNSRLQGHPVRVPPPPGLVPDLEELQMLAQRMLRDAGVESRSATVDGWPVVEIVSGPGLVRAKLEESPVPIFWHPLVQEAIGLSDGYVNGSHQIYLGTQSIVRILLGDATTWEHEIGHAEKGVDQREGNLENPRMGFFTFEGAAQAPGTYGASFGADEALQQGIEATKTKARVTAVLGESADAIARSGQLQSALFFGTAALDGRSMQIGLLMRQITALDALLETASRNQSRIEAVVVDAARTGDDVLVGTRVDGGVVNFNFPASMAAHRDGETWLVDYLRRQREQANADLQAALTDIPELIALERSRRELAHRVVAELRRRGAWR